MFKIHFQSEIVQQEHGPVTILINNAGVVAPGRILELKDDDIETIFRVNILAQLRVKINSCFFICLSFASFISEFQV